ncbi:MAG TPA: cytochrome c-type biogenesis protein CcmH, partial [Anaerolineae bacterium]|nr:cytochrome c-type biogenesis protein CcmH [Anaerolineae bacterium]
IQDYFVQQYGERVLGAPRAQGLNVLVYALPALVVASGAAILYLFARRRLNRAPSEVPPTPIVNEYRSRIERELKENE